MQLACSIPSDRLVTIRTYLANLTDRSFPTELEIIEELLKRQALISGTQDRGTKRKADGRPEATQANVVRAVVKKRVQHASKRQRDVGIGGTILADAFETFDLADSVGTTSQEIPVFLHKTWNPLLDTFRSASGLQGDDKLPESLVNLHDEDVEAMIKDGAVLEKRINAAFSLIAGP
jgi:hypothetical protein